MAGEAAGRREELGAELVRLERRARHLMRQARRVERGQRDEKRRFEGEGGLRDREEVVRFQPCAAVAYWREVREVEARCEELRRELRRQAEGLGDGGALHVYVHYDGQDGQDGRDGRAAP